MLLLLLSREALACPAGGGSPGGRFTVVIDAGHGGRDPGALGKQASEKSINLAIALKLGALIEESMKEVSVIYTRKTDRFVELHRRAAIANESKADLFISIHCNANKNPALKGAETYVMGLHRSKANLDVAKFENAAILLESDYQASYEGFDPNSDESYILFSLNQNVNLERSTRFAAAVQEQLEEKVGMNNRGVRQAGFLVLYRTTMPSVLVETGYLSNPGEEKFLASVKGQEFIASAIFRAFREMVATGEDVREEQVVRKEEAPVTAPNATDRLSYRVQVAADAKPLTKTSPRLKKFPEAVMYRHGGLYKYTIGDEPDMPSVLKLLGDAKARGASDAFIVIFRNGERIPQPEADRLMRK